MHTPELILALDFHDTSMALDCAHKMKGIVAWMKVGLELYVHAGPDIVLRLKDMGFKIFLDLKLYDIPNTVYGGVAAAAALGADMLTIHIQGGERMAQQALRAAQEVAVQGLEQPRILGVTVLTSMTQEDIPWYTESISGLTHALAQYAQQWGLHGVVCSGHEAETIKTLCGTGFLCVTPGIRPAHGAADDQRRVMTPRAAVLAGSDYLVVGRPITTANDPVAVVTRMVEEIRRTCNNNHSI